MTNSQDSFLNKAISLILRINQTFHSSAYMPFYKRRSNFPRNASVFGGFEGGYSQGNTSTSMSDTILSLSVRSLESRRGLCPPSPNMNDSGYTHRGTQRSSRVDPSNYPGRVHFGPAYTIIGPHFPRLPPGNGYIETQSGALIITVF